MTPFFIPELGLDGTSDEAAYAAIRRTARDRTGYEPDTARIFKLLCRRGGIDCEAEVGKPDPVCGHVVLAILDLGRHSPYLVECRSSNGRPARHMVEKPVYAVTEFSAPRAA
jgi:hypothetical protein